ncbi:MAG: hypothetical protein P9D89_11285 [Candidatus Contendobacter sp.]|nr:hypothetical protein [Candidatus Contendobacter sp.]
MELRRDLTILPWAILLAACAVNPPQPPNNPVAASCLELYAALDTAVVEQGTMPSSPARIPGFPYLRVERFLSSYREQALSPAEIAAWLTRLNALDREARRLEWNSLSDPVRTALKRRHAPASEVPAVLERCAATLQAADRADSGRLALIRQRAQVADDYDTVNQVLGLYPLTALPVDFGIDRFQQETRALFAQPLAALPVRGELRRFGPDTASPVPVNLTDIPRDALGIPEPTPAQLEALFAAHAPLWEIDVATDADRPGAPYWRADGLPTVNPAEPAVYRYVSYARWRGNPLLQLNYLIWFAARPRIGAFDLLGGPLDGVLWRVTLDHRSGQALLYDSIHACGCYHQLFPGPALRLRPETAQWAEPPLAPQPAPALGHGERLILRLSSGSHSVQRVYADRPGRTIALDERDYMALYTVPVENGAARSLFGPDGLVTGSERAERWWLWPMGVASPGAMRERGRHAIAFVGRRHFDDADLLDRLFQPAQEER